MIGICIFNAIAMSISSAALMASILDDDVTWTVINTAFFFMNLMCLVKNLEKLNDR